MHVLTGKRETAALIQLTLRFYADTITLELDKQACIKCDICQTVCPKEAIRVEVLDEALDITIDPDRCVLCEMCSYFCPVSCIKLSYNLNPKRILIDQQALPVFPEKINVDTSRCPLPCALSAEVESRWCRRERQWIDNHQETCPKYCHTCLENCPREAFFLEDSVIQVQSDSCLRCALCMVGCEYGAIVVQPIFDGVIQLDDSKCPDDCTLCIDWCPTKCIVREGQRVLLQRDRCAFCGTCVNICPEEAIKLSRQRIYAQDEPYSEGWSTVVSKLKGDTR